MSRTLRVTGEGSVNAKQDKTRLLITLRDSFPTYNEALMKISQDSMAVREMLESEKCGFTHQDIKVVVFDIRRTERRVEKREGSGIKYDYVVSFEAVNTLKVEFDNDKHKLAYMLGYLSALEDIQPSITIDYFVSDIEKYKEEALKLAVEDAKSKADLLAEASGVKLLEISDISYSWDMLKIQTQQSPLKFGALSSDTAYKDVNTDFVADDKQIRNSVNIIWSIE